MPKKSPAQLDREIAETLSSMKKQSRAPQADAYKQALLEDAIEAVYNRKGSEDLTLAEACEAVRELGIDASDKTIAASIKRQIPDWF